MDHHGHTGLMKNANGSPDMIHMPVNPAVRQNPHQMGASAAVLHPFHEVRQGPLIPEGSVLDRQFDRAKVHRNHAARTDIRMSDLGIAHLSGRKPRIGAVRQKLCIRAGLHQAVEMWRPGQGRCIAVRLGPFAPPVENAQDDWFRNGHDRTPFRSCVVI